MKKTLILVSLAIFLSGMTDLLASDSKALPGERKNEMLVSENKNDRLSDEDIRQLELRVLEIRDMDRSVLTDEEKLELREELRDIGQAVKQPYVYISIGGGTILLIILLILLLR
jgi:hypothetical protein